MRRVYTWGSARGAMAALAALLVGCPQVPASAPGAEGASGAEGAKGAAGAPGASGAAGALGVNVVEVPGAAPAGAIAVAGGGGKKPRFVIGEAAFAACSGRPVTFTGDGTAILAGGPEGSVTVVDPATGEASVRLRAPDVPAAVRDWARVTQIEATASGFVTGDDLGRVVVWTYGAKGVAEATASVLRPGSVDGGERAELASIAASWAGDRVVAVPARGAPELWDVAKKKKAGREPTEAEAGGLAPAVLWPSRFTFSPDGARLVGAGRDDGIEIVSPATMAVTARSDEVAGQVGALRDVAVTASGFVGLRIARGDSPRAEVTITRLDAGAKLAASVVLRPGAVDAAALSRDGKLLALAQGGRVRVLSAETGEERLVARPFSPSVTRAEGLVFSRDGSKLLATGDQGNVIDTSTGKLAREPVARPLVGARRVAFGPGGLLAIASDRTTRIVSLDGSGGALEVGIEADDGMAFAADGRSFVGQGESLFRLDLAARAITWERAGKSSVVMAHDMAATPDLGLVTYAGFEGKLFVVDGKTGELAREIDTPCGEISMLVPRGAALGCPSDKALRFFDPATGKAAGSVAIEGTWITAVGRSHALVSVRGEKLELVMIDLASGAVKARMDHRLPAAIAPDGAWVAGWDEGGEALVLREVATGKERRVERPGAQVTSLAFDAKGELLAVGALRSVEVWSARDLIGGAP